MNAKRKKVVCFLVALLPATAATVFGQTFWIAESGNWNTAGNWTLGVPDASSLTTFDAVVANSGTAQLTDLGASVRRLRIGRIEGPGQLQIIGGGLTVTENLHLNETSAGLAAMTVQNGGTVTSPNTVVGYSGDFNSTLLVTDAGSILTTDEINVGQGSTGTLTIAAGGEVSDIDGFVGRFALSVGTASVDGAGSTWTNTGILRIGHIGTGTLFVTNGGMVTSEFGYISVGHESSSATTVSGAGSSWNNGDVLFVGYEGTGDLTVDEGGSVSSGSAVLGRFGGSSGNVTVSGASSMWNNDGEMLIGDEGHGRLTIGESGQVTTDYVIIANDALSVSSVRVDGNGSTWTSDGAINVGYAGFGEVVVTGGGQVVQTSFGSANLGVTAGAEGRVTIENAGSSWTTDNAMILGGAGGTPTDPGGNATLTIRNGGLVASNTGYVAYAPGSKSNVFVEGASSMWTTNELLAVGTYGLGGLQITAGGKVDTGGDAYIGGAFGGVGSGAVVVDGAGSTWTLSNDVAAGIYVGDDGPGSLTVTNGGTVSVASFNGIQIGSQGIVTGDGTLNAWVYNYGTVAPGASIGTLTITGGPYRQGPDGKLEIELASAASFDQLNFPDGGAFLEGGSLDVTLVGGFVPGGGTSFDLMDWHQFGGITGTFTTLNLPPLPVTHSWDTSQLYTMGMISVIGPPSLLGDFDGNGEVGQNDYETWRSSFGSTTELAADANLDGTVNAADYVVWRNALGTSFAQAHGEVPRSHSGQSVGSGTVLTAVGSLAVGVPEPASLVLAVVAAGIAMKWRRTVQHLT
jgi:T5SS/PEP-CTERM-associated repeat protein